MGTIIIISTKNKVNYQVFMEESFPLSQIVFLMQIKNFFKRITFFYF